MQDSLIQILRLEFQRNCEIDILGILSDSLKDVDKLLQKRIIAASIELFQNAEIHCKNKAEFCIYQSSRYICVEIKQQLSVSMLANLESKIKKLNEIEMEDLKIMYRNNLIRILPSNHSRGNGLILCRLKSSNKINIRKIDNVLVMTLKFEL